MKGREASPEQMAYINGLIGRVVELTDTPRDVDIDTPLTRSEASVMIDGLIKAIDRLGGHLSQGERRKLAFEGHMPLRSALTDRQKASLNGATPPAPVLDKYSEKRQRAIEYNTAQSDTFGTVARKEPPTAKRKKKLVVWQKQPHVMRLDGTIKYGWAWECTHPNHRRRIMGASQNSHDECLNNALYHWEKFHRGEQISQ